MKSCQSVAEFFSEEERNDNKMKLLVASHKYTNAPKNCPINQIISLFFHFSSQSFLSKQFSRSPCNEQLVSAL